MSRDYVIKHPTPEMARRIIKLKTMLPDLFVDDAIYELAKIPSFEPKLLSGMAPMTPAQTNLIQELLDFKLRAIIVVPDDISLNISPLYWMRPIFTAAKLQGLTDLVFVDNSMSPAQSKIAGIAAEYGLRLIPNNPWETGEDYGAVRKTGMLLSTMISTTGRPLTQLTLEFPRSIVVAPSRVANESSLFPHMPTLSQLFERGQAMAARGFTNTQVRNLASLLNVATSISTKERIP